MKNPKNIFLLDGLGGLLTGIFLIVVLPYFQDAIGLPINVLYALGAIGVCYGIYSLSCFRFVQSNFGVWLKVIVLANLIYCVVIAGVVTFFLEEMTLIGIGYFAIEVLVILALVFVEIRILLRIENSKPLKPFATMVLLSLIPFGHSAPSFASNKSSAPERVCVFPMGATPFACTPEAKGEDLFLPKNKIRGLKFDRDGLIGGHVNHHGCVWLNRNGLMRPTHCFDNGPDYFEEGLARYIDSKGRFGYMNKKLKIVIPAQFTFAFPFRDGIANVCNGCETKTKGEYSVMEGGEWWTINKTGKIVEKSK